MHTHQRLSNLLVLALFLTSCVPIRSKEGEPSTKAWNYLSFAPAIIQCVSAAEVANQAEDGVVPIHHDQPTQVGVVTLINRSTLVELALDLPNIQIDVAQVSGFSDLSPTALAKTIIFIDSIDTIQESTSEVFGVTGAHFSDSTIYIETEDIIRDNTFKHEKPPSRACWSVAYELTRRLVGALKMLATTQNQLNTYDQAVRDHIEQRLETLTTPLGTPLFVVRSFGSPD